MTQDDASKKPTVFWEAALSGVHKARQLANAKGDLQRSVDTLSAELSAHTNGRVTAEIGLRTFTAVASMLTKIQDSMGFAPSTTERQTSALVLKGENGRFFVADIEFADAGYPLIFEILQGATQYCESVDELPKSLAEILKSRIAGEALVRLDPSLGT